MATLELVKVGMMAGCLAICAVVGPWMLLGQYRVRRRQAEIARRQEEMHREQLAEIRAAGIVARAVAEEGGGDDVFPPPVSAPMPVQGPRRLRAVRAERPVARFVRGLVAVAAAS